MRKSYHTSQDTFQPALFPSIEHKTTDCSCTGWQCCHCEKMLCRGYFYPYSGECLLCKKAKRDARTPEEVAEAKAKYKVYYQTHKEQIQDTRIVYYQTHKEDYVRRSNKHYSQWEGKPQRYHKQSIQQARKDNKLRKNELTRKYHIAREQARVGKVSYERVLERDGMWCYICEQPILDDQKLSFDHVIPVSRQGTHSEENIKPAHFICNCRKHARLLEEMDEYQRRGIV